MSFIQQHPLCVLFSSEPEPLYLLSLEDGIFTSSSSATAQQSRYSTQEANVLPNEVSLEDEGSADTTDA